MGSDSMQKSKYGLQESTSLKVRKLAFAFLSLFFLIVGYHIFYVTKTRISVDGSGTHTSMNINSQQRRTQHNNEELNSSKSSIPKQCHSTLDRVMKCQRRRNNKSSATTIVFACHRKWCNSFYGHCETVNGIGDRTKHMLSLFSDASLDKCLRVELDYPQQKHGIELRFDDFEYHDPWGFIAELFHFRSYDVSDLKVDVEGWGIKKETTNSKEINQKNDNSNNGNDRKTFVPFIPSHDQYQFHKYDPCLYHILFKTTSILDTEIQYYSDLVMLHDNNVIGMHFRTGDLTAFGLNNKDIRTRSDRLLQSYDMMMKCAQIHAINLGIQAKKGGKSNNHNDENNEKIKIFLATDNQMIKEKAKNDKRFTIFMTEDKPTAYVRSEGDRSAYTDLYLLSKTRGLVVNELPNVYDGPAEKVSTFAQLAMTIGFMNDSQLYKCKLD